MKLLYVMYRFPYPLIRGDKLRAFNQIKYLSKKHEVVLCSIIDEPIDENSFKQLEPYCKEIHTFSISKFQLFNNLLYHLFTNRPLQNAFVYFPRIKKAIKEIAQKNGIQHCISLMVRPAEYVSDLDIPKTLDYQDVLSKGFERRSDSARFPFNYFYKFEASRIARYEEILFELFDNKLIITEEDRNFIPHKLRDNIHIISNGIDLDYFTPQNIEKEYDLVFVGNMKYQPNILAMKYLCEEILPELRKFKPNIKLLIAGADPIDSILALKSESINVTGRLDDIRWAYSKGKVFVAPLLIGTGLQNKLLEAMAMQLPVVTSPLCNRALYAEHNKDIIIAKSTEEYINHIVNLLSNNELANIIAMNGNEFVKQNFSWERVNDKLEKIISGNN